MSEIRRLQAERMLGKYTHTERARHQDQLAYLGDGLNGSSGVNVPNRPEWVYARLYGSSDAVVEAKNPGQRVLPYDNLRVRVKRVRQVGQSYYEIVGYEEGTTWVTGIGSGTGIGVPPTMLSGDLSGSLPSPTVIGLYNNPVSADTPNTDEFLKWNGSQWVGANFIGLATGSAAGGDLTGTYPSPTIAKLQGRTIATTTPGVNSGLVYNGAVWAPTGVIIHQDQFASDLASGILNPTVRRLQGRRVSAQAPNHGQFLGWNGTATQWEPMTATGTAGGNFLASGTAAGGDLTGTLPSPTVSKLQGRPVSSAAPSTGNSLAWNGTQWMPSGIAGGGGGSAAFSGARAYNDAGQTISNNTSTPLTFNKERFDTDAYHSTVTNPTRMTIPSDGIYHVGAGIYIPGGGGNIRQIWLLLNGTTGLAYDRRAAAGGGNDNALTISTAAAFVAGDYVEAMFYQDSGGDLTSSTAAGALEMWIYKLGTL